MLDDRDHRPTAPVDWDNAKSASAGEGDRDGCSFWAAVFAGGLVVLLAGYGLAALSDGVVRTLLTVSP